MSLDCDTIELLSGVRGNNTDFKIIMIWKIYSESCFFCKMNVKAWLRESVVLSLGHSVHKL